MCSLLTYSVVSIALYYFIIFLLHCVNVDVMQCCIEFQGIYIFCCTTVWRRGTRVTWCLWSCTAYYWAHSHSPSNFLCTNKLGKCTLQIFYRLNINSGCILCISVLWRALNLGELSQWQFVQEQSITNPFHWRMLPLKNTRLMHLNGRLMCYKG